MQQCVYLGHLVGDAEYVLINLGKLEVIETFPRRRFVHSLVLLAIARSLYPDYAITTAPLTDLRKDRSL